MINSASPSMENQRPIPEPEEEKYIAPLFAPSYYIAHLVMVLYILIGIGTQVAQYIRLSTYRMLSVATWPWVLTGNAWLLLLATIVYGACLYIIARHMRSKLEELEITWYSLAPYILFAFVFLGMFGRLMVYFISPEGMFVDPLMIGK